MKLVEMKCKNCGAQLKVDVEKNHSYCQFCGTEFKIDDEVKHVKYDNMEQSGYEFEKGRMRAQKETFDNIVNNINQSVNNSSNNDYMFELLITIFLGPLGVHKFMNNEIGMGILYLLTGGLFGIGWIIDIVKVAEKYSSNKKK